MNTWAFSRILYGDVMELWLLTETIESEPQLKETDLCCFQQHTLCIHFTGESISSRYLEAYSSGRWIDE